MPGLILYSAIVTPQPTPTRVLVIDDDPMSRDLLRVLLEGQGYEVECADSGEAALAQLSQAGHAPNLVFADVQMPGLTGNQLAGELRRACPPSTLLLAMSGSRPPDQAIAHFDGLLLKPFKMQDVASALAARNPPSGAIVTPARRERWTVVTGPAARSPSNSKWISIAASSAPRTESNRDKRSQPRNRCPPKFYPAEGPT